MPARFRPAVVSVPLRLMVPLVPRLSVPVLVKLGAVDPPADTLMMPPPDADRVPEFVNVLDGLMVIVEAVLMAWMSAWLVRLPVPLVCWACPMPPVVLAAWEMLTLGPRVAEEEALTDT